MTPEEIVEFLTPGDKVTYVRKNDGEYNALVLDTFSPPADYINLVWTPAAPEFDANTTRHLSDATSVHHAGSGPDGKSEWFEMGWSR